MTASDPSDTPWRRGRLRRGGGRPELLFGRMMEDWLIERSHFPRTGRVFAIASAGCTALALAAEGARVTAVDINPAQVDYVRLRLHGGPPAEGAAERLIRRGRAALRALGVLPRARVRSFLMLEDPAEQVEYWRSRLAPARFRIALRLALSRPLLRIVYLKEFLAAIPSDFSSILLRRLERTWRLHPNRGNPYAWRALLGEERPEATPPSLPAIAPNVHCADAAEYLEDAPAGAFDAFTLSNILDGAGPAYAARLRQAVARAASPGAIVLLRSFAEPTNAQEEELAAADRSFLWGRIVLTTAEAFAAQK